MSLETTVKECTVALTSSRATERKRGAESLKEFLSRNAVPTLLSENTLRKNGYCWNNIFDDINDFILKETEKFETAKNFETVIGPLCASLLHLCISGANKGQAYVSCDRIMDSCLLIMKDSRLVKAVGDAYLNLLYKHVLPCEYYLGYITPTAWEDLVDVCLSACLSKGSKLDNFTKMRLLWLVMKNAKDYCHFVIPLRDSLSRLKKCFIRTADDKKAQEIVIEIMILLVETLSSECRLTMCEFVESHISATLKFYDQNLDQKKKASVFKLLQVTVQLHHPNGRLQNEEGSMAHDWSNWNKQLHSMLEVIFLEVTYLQKRRKQSENENILKHCSELFNLAAIVYFQIFNLSVPRDDTLNESSKRQRISINKNKCFTDLIEELRQNQGPWLPIVHMYIKHYGQTISSYDCITLISVLESLVTNNNNLNWAAFEETTCLVLKRLTSRDDADQSDYVNVLTTLWNSCARTSTLANATHKSLHTVMQFLLTLNILKYQNIQPLIKLYFEKGMPVTDYSIKTLNYVFHKFFSKSSYIEERMKFLSWLIQGQFSSIQVNSVKELLLRLTASENIDLDRHFDLNESDDLYEVSFTSIEKSILFSEFEIDISKPQLKQDQTKVNCEMVPEINKEILEFLEATLSKYSERLKTKEVTLLEYIMFVSVVLTHLDILLKHTFFSREQVKKENIFRLLKLSLRFVYMSLMKSLKDQKENLEHIKALKALQGILVSDYDALLCSEVRQCINEDFFHCINNILNSESLSKDEDFYEEDDSEYDPNALKHNCLLLLAAYCRQKENFRDEILDLILDYKLYNFKMSWDIDCAVECIELLNNSTAEKPLEAMFTLIQNMCKALFRNPNASHKILRLLSMILDEVWNSGANEMKVNSHIMVKGYMQRCETLYYPPRVAGMVYECAMKIDVLNLKHNRDADTTFMEALMEKVKGNIHCLRIYCSYLLKHAIAHIADSYIEAYLTRLVEIYVIQVSEKTDTILKDEAANRTLSVLHCFYALVQAKNSLIHTTVTELMHLQKDVSLDKRMVKKVLIKICNDVSKKDLANYLNDNVLNILNFWLSKGHNVEQLPLYLFGVGEIDEFLEKHLKWTVAADILWRRDGIVKNSEILKHVHAVFGKPVVDIIEACINNILVLCLPYLVIEKYSVSYTSPGKLEWMSHAVKLFHSTRQILDNTKWSSLFATNVSELMVMIALHLSDIEGAKRQFHVEIPKQKESYRFPKEVFQAIINYIGELIDENTMEYLCSNHPRDIFKALFKLWDRVRYENVFEYKVLALHSYITFIEFIPFGFPSDAFVRNYACNSIANAIKDSNSKKEIKALIISLKSILERFLIVKPAEIKESVAQILSILMIKKEEGFEEECYSLLTYLVSDMKSYLRESEDVVDFVRSLSQGVVENVNCTTKMEFVEKLRTYNKSLSSPSHETLLHLRQYIRTNKRYVNALCEDLNPKGFSDDCGASLIHQIIYALSNTLKTASDDKTKIEACNCLSQIGNYDLKTLVTIPPQSTQGVMNIGPQQYFAIVTLNSLSEILFDENPAVTSAVTSALTRLLTFRDGKTALDLQEIGKQVLTPFSTANCNSYAEFSINEGKLNSAFAPEYWVPSNHESHAHWLMRMAVALANVLASGDNYLESLSAVCVLKPTFCRKILPSLLGLILNFSAEKHIELISGQIDQFFKHIWGLYFDNQIESSEDSNAVSRLANSSIAHDRKMIVHYMLDVVNFIRLQRGHYKNRQIRTVETLNYLRLEYDKVSWAASVSDQNLAAIYYGELWAVAKNEGVPPSSPDDTTLLLGGENVQRIFRKSYVSIGEVDALEGCGTAHLTGEYEKRKHLINTGQFTDALLLHDIALSMTAPTADKELQYGAVKSLHKSGMHHLALQYIKSLPENDELNDIKYECLSFLGDWSDLVDTRVLEYNSKQANSNAHSIIKAFRYSCLKDCINLQATPDFEDKLMLPLNRAKLAVARLCKNLNMENCQNVYKLLSKLHLFSDIEDYSLVRCGKTTIEELVSHWQVDNLPAYHDFRHLEALISQRCLILEQASKIYKSSLKDIVSLQLQYSELSLSNHRVQMAQRLLAVVKQMHSSPEVSLTDSQISWAKGHKDIALSLMRNIVARPPPDVRLAAISLRKYGLWMAESKSESARDIINKYLKKSLEVLKKNGHDQTRLKVYYDIAKFADAEYKQVVAYMNSSVFEKKVKCVEMMKDTASSLKVTQQALTRDERKVMITNDRFGQIDEAEIASTRAEKESFLQLAMRYYLLSLKEGEANNLSMFRVISLWLDNPSLALEDGDPSDFEELLHTIPSRKYVTVLPQLAPRLTNDETVFAENLRRIIKRCATEHPHHTLPILFSLKNSDKDKYILNTSKCIGKHSQRASSHEPRVAAAQALIHQLAQENAVLDVIISQMDRLCDATISFANYSYIPKTKEPRHKIPAAERIHRLGTLDAIPIPTVTIPINTNCSYTNLQTIHSFENYFELVGGINCPKKISCKGSDGVSRILLIKGEDDLRQDAMMQQVFNIVNTLLDKNPVTSRNKLVIRTYKVVPMSRKSGVLEWCEGTMPIGTYLIGTSGAHARYRPKDISAAAARARLAPLHEKRRPNQEKLAVFLRILQEFKPVFHYFFTEHFLDPVTWYERRLAYTKSVAASSMVGYIMGLGDRHLQNILIDKRTAEVVHIDFGIAFDQGKTLPTPETIPFRLTQDIVAGFGSSGVEGIFRRCCEKTMQLLRDNQETLLTILEVLLCDPLHSWTVTSKQQNVLTAPSKDTTAHQSHSDGSLAKRALLTISSKLSGTEGGAAGGVAVPGLVARLLQTAMDAANLSRLYPGWQPYL